jgi:methionyl-tRNA formyltransferase
VVPKPSNEPVRFAFLTGHAFGRAALDGILAALAPDRSLARALSLEVLAGLHPDDAATTVGYSDVGDLADRARSFLYVRKDDATQLRNRLSAARLDFIFVVGWSRLVPPELLDLPKGVQGRDRRHGPSWGAIGMHPTLLPEGRGRAPIPWTILKGLAESGVTAFLLESEADSGAIVAQRRYAISPEETASTLFEKAREAHYSLGREVAEQMSRGAVLATPQDEGAATYWERRRPSDGEIRFDQPTEMIERLLRAVAEPYPGALLRFEGQLLKVEEARVELTVPPAPPGTVCHVSSEGHVEIAALDGVVSIVRVSRSGQSWPPPIGRRVGYESF